MSSTDAIDGDRRVPLCWRGGVTSDQLLAIGAPSLIASAALAGVGWLGALLGALGIVLSVPSAIAARRNVVAQTAVGVALAWVVFGALVDSLPSVTDQAAVRRWVETEGRAIVVLGVIVAMVGLQRSSTFEVMLRRIMSIVVLLSAAGLALFVAGVDMVNSRGLFQGFSTSHHVPGFLAGAALLVLAVWPTILPDRRLVAASGVILFFTMVLTGSRASLVASCLGLVIVFVRRWRGRALLVSVVGALVAVGLVFATSSRVRETADLVVSGGLLSDARVAFTSGSKQRAIELSDSESSANILIRFALWGEAMNTFESSPIVGIGRFRVNDSDLQYWGTQGWVWVATGGDRVHSDDEPHNQVLYLLAETGIVGLLAYATPFALAWRWTKRGPDGTVGDERWRMLSRVSLAYAVIIGLVSSGTMGTGLGLITAVLYFGAGRAYALESADALHDAGVEVGHP